MDNCIFCKVIKGDIPSSKVYEDNETFAFLDINPINKGHTLVVPKTHSVNLFDISENDANSLINAVIKVSKGLSKAEKCAVKVEANNGKAAGQVVFHSHFHLIPRFENDKKDSKRSHEKYEGKERDEIAERIKNAI